MHALEKEIATYSSVLAWRIPGTEEPGGLTLCLSGTLTGRFFHVYTDYKKHPAMYTAPYPTWLEKLDMDFMIYGIGILICIVVVTALTIILGKTKNRQG